MVNTTDDVGLDQRRLADAVRRVRRRLGLRRRDDPLIAGRPRRAGRHRACSRTTTNVFDGLKDLPHNTVDGVNYGVPHGRGANVLVWNTEMSSPRPRRQWDVIWEDGADYAGKISIYDSSIFIADAALHLMATQPGSGDREPVPAEPGAVRRVDRAARGPRRERSALLGACGRPDRVIRLRRRRRSGRPGSTR